MPYLGTVCPDGTYQISQLKYHFPVHSEHFLGKLVILDDSMGHLGKLIRVEIILQRVNLVGPWFD